MKPKPTRPKQTKCAKFQRKVRWSVAEAEEPFHSISRQAESQSGFEKLVVHAAVHHSLRVRVCSAVASV